MLSKELWKQEEAQHSREGDQDQSVVVPATPEAAGPDKNTNWTDLVCSLLCVGPGTKVHWFICVYTILFLVVVTVIQHRHTNKFIITNCGKCS